MILWFPALVFVNVEGIYANVQIKFLLYILLDLNCRQMSNSRTDNTLLLLQLLKLTIVI